MKKSPPEKGPPDSKPNPIPNLTLSLPLNPHGGFFPGIAYIEDCEIIAISNLLISLIMYV